MWIFLCRKEKKKKKPVYVDWLCLCWQDPQQSPFFIIPLSDKEQNRIGETFGAFDESVG
jgi:hypothetical protein